MEENKYKVYVKIDSNNIVNEINSSIFIQDLADWIYIDEGIDGEKYARAQVNYLEKGLMDSNFKFNYKLVDGKVVELTEEEKTTLFSPELIKPNPQELLNSKLLMDNANMQLEINSQKQLNADLLLKMAQLGGTQ